MFAQSYSATTIAGATVIRDGVPAAEAFLRNPTGVAVDSQGNIYVADSDDNRIRKISRDGIITTIAGTGSPGFSGDGKPASQAKLDGPRSIAVDRTSTYLYFADRGNRRVRRISLTTGEILTIAGNGTARSSGDGDQATRAGMSPYTVALDTTGSNLFIVEYVNHRVRKLDLASGVISAFAGSGTPGDSGDNGPGPNALLFGPKAVAADANSVHIADWGNSLIRKVDLKTNILTTFGGLEIPVDYGDNGPVDRAAFYGPDSIHSDSDGNLLIVDGSKLRFIAAGSNVITGIAGVADSIGFAGDGGALSSARFANPATAIIVRKGEYLVADSGNYKIRRIQGGELSTVIGAGAVDGKVATASLFNLPISISRDSAGNIFVADTANNRIRKIAAGSNIVSTVAGNGVRGSREGRISSPSGVLAAPDGVYFSDSDNNRVYRIAADGIRVVAGSATALSGFSGDGQVATSARLQAPRGLARDANGNLYIADWGNGRVRRISPEGVIATVAGNGQILASGDGGPAIAAGLSPASVAVDSGGNLYIADDVNNRIRKVTAGSGIITTVAGTGQIGNAGDGGPATQAQIVLPFGIAVDAQNNLFISDSGNLLVRRVDGRTGVITSIAGNGAFAFNGETGAALGLSMSPADIAVEPVGGTLLIADSLNDRIRRLTPLVPRSLLISSGNAAKGHPGGQLAISVRVADATGASIAGALVNFTVAAGDAKLKPAAVQTGIDGIASSQVTLGEVLGTITIRAESPGLTPVVFSLVNEAEVLILPTPVISDVMGYPQSTPPSRVLAKNGLILIIGDNLSPNAAPKPVSAADLAAGKLPTSFNGSCVDIGGALAPLLSVSAKQIVAQTPDLAGSATGSVKVLSGCGTVREVASDGSSVAVKTVAPEFFYAQRTSSGGNRVSVLSLASGAPVKTVQPGDDIILYLTGLGATDPAYEPGQIVGDNAFVTALVQVKLGGEVLSPDNVLYVGTTAEYPGEAFVPGISQNAGIYQIRIVVPGDAPDGDLSIQVMIGDQASPDGTLLTVQRAPALSPFLRRNAGEVSGRNGKTTRPR